MRVREFLTTATAQLKRAGIATARLDSLVLLEDVLNTNRTQILAEPDLLIATRQLKKLQQLVDRRALHEPLAYIRNQTEFYGRSFYIDRRVLEPRPESETMIELLKQLGLDQNDTIVDVGTGSGALAITAKLELPNMTVIGIDIDPGCLAVARRNAKRLDASLTFLSGNLVAPLQTMPSEQPTTLLCNLPYVPDNFQINTAAGHEPRHAIFGGPDGLDLYRQLFTQLSDGIPAKFVLTESLPPQHGALSEIAQHAGYQLEQTDDFIQVFRRDTGSSGS